MKGLILSHNPAALPLGATGIYRAWVGEEECLVQLSVGAGAVMGTFKTAGETIEISGRVSRSGHLSGFLLEPTQKSPIGVFRARLEAGGLLLAMDIPDFEELLELCDLEPIHFARIEEGFSQEEESFSQEKEDRWIEGI